MQEAESGKKGGAEPAKPAKPAAAKPAGAKSPGPAPEPQAKAAAKPKPAAAAGAGGGKGKGKDQTALSSKSTALFAHLPQHKASDALWWEQRFMAKCLHIKSWHLRS